jgi:BlaI family transcriptional regulator, penicillinase repressor
MAAKTPTISDAEWEVMNVLWEQSPQTAGELAEALCERMNWSAKTLKTLLSRLVKKGVLRTQPQANRYLYSPLFPRSRYVRQESASFVDRVFGGGEAPMILHFVRRARLSKDEIEELRRILDEKSEEQQ